MADESHETAHGRTYDRFERQVATIHEFEAAAEEVTFPVTAAELGAEHRSDDEGGVDGGSLGSVLNRLDGEYDDERAARQAVLKKLDEVEAESSGVVDDADNEESDPDAD
jgi:hypothetical protein